MKRSGTIHTIHELSAQGKSVRAIAQELGIARNTVRRYLRGKPDPVPRPKRGSLLDPYKAQIHRWMQEDHLYNCEAMLERLREQGYTGSGTILRDYPMRRKTPAFHAWGYKARCKKIVTSP